MIALLFIPLITVTVGLFVAVIGFAWSPFAAAIGAFVASTQSGKRRRERQFRRRFTPLSRFLCGSFSCWIWRVCTFPRKSKASFNSLHMVIGSWL